MKTHFRIYYLVLIIFILVANTTESIARSKPDSDSLAATDSMKALPTIHLVTPNGGEQFTGFSLILVQWTGTNLSITDLPKIEISTDGGNTWTEDFLWYVISISDVGGSAYYLLPFTLSLEVKIKLSDYYHPEIFDVSDNDFSITSNQQILVIVNNPFFQKITSNSVIDFSFVSDYTFDDDYFTLSVTFDEGAHWEIIKEHVRIGLYVPGPCFWEIPENMYGTCQVKLQSENVPDRNGTSVYFTIHKVPEIEITANYPQNLIHTDTTFVIDYTKIDENYLYDLYLLFMSKDKGITWEFLKNLTLEANSGNFQLNAPMQEIDSCLYRVVDAINGNSADVTDYISFRNFPATPICQVSSDPSTKKNLIKWSKPESEYITEYIVYRETDATGGYEEIGRVNKNNPGEFIDLTSKSDQRSYRYRLSYIDIEGRIYPFSTPHQTIHLSAYKNNVKEYNLNWSPYIGADIQSYTIYRGSSVANLSVIATLSGNNTSYTDFDAPTRSVLYQISAGGTSDCSGGIFNSSSNIAGESALSISENAGNEFFTLYPNPAKDKIVLTFEKPFLNLNYDITDFSGRVMQSNNQKTHSGSTIEIDLSDLNNGVYLLYVNTENFTATKKMIIDR